MNDQSKIAVRVAALKWFDELSLEEKENLMSDSSDKLISMPSRQAHTLTGREIEILWKENEK